MRAAIGLLILVITFLPPCGNALGQSAPSAEMKEDIRMLMNVTGASELGLQAMNQTVGALREVVPDIPEAFFTRFMAKVDTNDLVELAVPIYAKHFTHDEIKQLLAFYRTPLGQKMIATLPTIIQESGVVFGEWGKNLGLLVADELEAEGYELGP